MGRKIVRLTLDNVALVQAPCRDCLFWELDPVRRTRVRPADAVAEKEAWLSGVLRDWGSCGRVALVDDVPVGFVVYAPPAYLPGSAGFPTAPVSPDAVLLTTVYVDPAQAGGGLGRMLVQAMARDLIQRGGVRAVEAFGDTRIGRSTEQARGRTPQGARPSAGPWDVGPGRRCVLPAEFLGSVGFKTQRAHGVTPRMRMDLRSALTWRDEFEHALERLLGAVRPAPRATRTGP